MRFLSIHSAALLSGCLKPPLFSYSHGGTTASVEIDSSLNGDFGTVLLVNGHDYASGIHCKGRLVLEYNCAIHRQVWPACE